MIASGIGMAIIFQFTVENFQEDVININVETSYIHWRNTFPAVSMCLTKGFQIVWLKSSMWVTSFFYRRISYENSKLYDSVLAGQQYNSAGKVTQLKKLKKQQNLITKKV